jgi:hypothetical protein
VAWTPGINSAVAVSVAALLGDRTEHIAGFRTAGIATVEAGAGAYGSPNLRRPGADGRDRHPSRETPTTRSTSNSIRRHEPSPAARS